MMMLNYYFELALRSFKSSRGLTALMLLYGVYRNYSRRLLLDAAAGLLLVELSLLTIPQLIDLGVLITITTVTLTHGWHKLWLNTLKI